MRNDNAAECICD